MRPSPTRAVYQRWTKLRNASKIASPATAAAIPRTTSARFGSDATVDDDAEQHRDRHGDHRVQCGGQQEDGEIPAVRPRVSRDPADGPPFSCCLVTDGSAANPRIRWGPGPGSIAARPPGRLAFAAPPVISAYWRLAWPSNHSSLGQTRRTDSGGVGHGRRWRRHLHPDRERDHEQGAHVEHRGRGERAGHRVGSGSRVPRDDGTGSPARARLAAARLAVP